MILDTKKIVFGWDADDNVDFQPHQVDNGWDEISDNEQQQQDEEVIVSIGDVIVAADALLLMIV